MSIFLIHWILRSMEELNRVLPEGLPLGMVKEFEESKRTALLVRQKFLDLRDHFRRIVDPPLQSSNGKGAIVGFHLECLFSLICLFRYPFIFFGKGVLMYFKFERLEC